MKFNFLAIAVLFLVIGCNQGKPKQAQEQAKDTLEIRQTTTPQQQGLTETINMVLKAYQNKDAATLNKLVNPAWGIYIVYRPGASDNFAIIDSIDFKNPEPHYYEFEDFKTTATLSYAPLPTFDCGTEKWSKNGLFCDSTANPTTLSQIADFMQTYNEAKYSEDQLQKIKNIEKSSFRVIATGEGYLSFIFQLTLLDGKWYLTLIDRAYGGCDA